MSKVISDRVFFSQFSIEADDDYDRLPEEEQIFSISLSFVDKSASKQILKIKAKHDTSRDSYIYRESNTSGFVKHLVAMRKTYGSDFHLDYLNQIYRAELEDINRKNSILDGGILTQDERIPAIGLSRAEAMIYALNKIKKIPLSGRNITTLDPTAQSEVISFYINCIISIIPDGYRNRPPWDFGKRILDLLNKRLVTLYEPSEKDFDSATKKKEKFTSKVIILGVMGILCVSKTYKTNADENERKNLREWINKRIPPLLIRLSIPQSQLLSEDITNDLIYLTSYLTDIIQVRKTLLYPFVTSENIPEEDVFNNIRNYVQMVIAKTGLQALYIAYNFGKSCETYAHTLQEVVRETELVESLVQRYEKDYSTKPYTFEYSWLMEGQNPALEARCYPNLLYAAMFDRKMRAGGSWVNFKIKCNPAIPIATLERLCKIRFSSATTQEDLSEEVKKFLEKKGKKISSEDKADL